MAVADHFDALSSGRPYRSGFSLEKTTAKLREEAGRTLDQEVVSALLGLLDAGELPIQLPRSVGEQERDGAS
jgi:HD-GYP domain-containing protein (c-di-GMP phosphodiesterase class II)